MRGHLFPLLAALPLLGCPLAGQARTLVVGAGAEYANLTLAARLAVDGDTIRLMPGEYFECVSLPQNQLLLDGQGATLTDRTCEGKALLVLQGNGTTVRDLTLARARVPDGNGAGIRLEGQGLLLERVRFENDQIGLLGGPEGPGAVRIIGCTFEGGGVGGPRALAAVVVGAVALLRIQGSVFQGGKGGQVLSAASRTELEDNRIAGGLEADGPPAVSVSGDTLLMRGNTVTLGPEAPARSAAVLMSGTRAELRGNRLENKTGRPMTLLLDWSASSPVLEGNVLAAGDTLSSTAGSWRHRAGAAARTVKSGVREAAGAVKRSMLGMLNW